MPLINRTANCPGPRPRRPATTSRSIYIPDAATLAKTAAAAKARAQAAAAAAKAAAKAAAQAAAAAKAAAAQAYAHRVLMTLSGQGIQNSPPFLIAATPVTATYTYDCGEVPSVHRHAGAFGEQFLECRRRCHRYRVDRPAPAPQRRFPGSAALVLECAGIGGDVDGVLLKRGEGDDLQGPLVG